MLSLIIFFIGCCITLTTSLVFLIDSMSWWLIVIITISSIIGMILINALIATIFCKWLPKKWFAGEKKIFNPSKKECKFYEKLGIKKWKDLNIDLGKLNGFKKNKIVDSPEYIERFILENNMGFVEHLISAFISFPLIFILPLQFWLVMGLPIAITSFILNIMPVMILRYNMPRLKTMLKFSLRNNNKTN